MVQVERDLGDPVLAAADAEMERRAAQRGVRMYLGMSGGGYCTRRQYYSWTWTTPSNIPARGLCAIDDGNRGEDVIAARIQAAPDILLSTRDPESGEQYECVDADGHVRGHMDGVIYNHPAAPKTPHVWEAKVVNERKFKEFQKIKARDGEKATLRQWDHVYWVQAQLYMHYGNFARHWITVASAGVRNWDAARTEYDRDEAEFYAERLRTIVENIDELPARVSETPAAMECRWCDFKEICHEGAPVAKNCRTCRYSRPVPGPQWECSKHEEVLDGDKQRVGCDDYEAREALR